MEKIKEAIRATAGAEAGAVLVPALWRCECGNELEIPNFTNTCQKCGIDYNSSGQMLAHRSQWGEETGESVADILAADTDPWGGDY